MAGATVETYGMAQETTRSEPAAVGADPRGLPGYAEAVHGLGTVGAPLLAGFGFTLVVYTLTATEAFRWPNAVLVLILGAALALLGAVQCAVIARLFVAGPGAPSTEQVRLGSAHRLWARRTELLYNAGILLLLAGITAALVPPGPLAEVRARLAAIALGLGGLVLVALWTAAGRRPARALAARFLGEPDGEGFRPGGRVGDPDRDRKEARWTPPPQRNARH